MAGNLDAYGIPSYGDSYEFPEDTNELAGVINTFANVRRGTAADRNALGSGQMRDGMLFSETDTGIIWLRQSGGWRVVFQDWVSWTPTITGFTLGNGSLTARYQRVGRRVHFEISMVLGSTSGATGNVGFSLPVTPADSVTKHVGDGVWTRPTIGTYPAQARVAGGSSVGVALFGTSGNVSTISLLSNSYPATPGNGDSLFLQGDYAVS